MKHLSFLLQCPNRQRLFTIALIVLFFCGCEKEPEPFADNGVISGYIELQSPSYEAINGNDVKVTAYGPYGISSTKSDPDGNYKLSGLGNGTYLIEYNKEDFGIFRRPGIQVFGNDTLTLSALLYKKAACRMPHLTAIKSAESGQLEIKTDIAVDEDMQIRLFLSDTKEVSYKNYIYTEMAGFYSKGSIIYMNYNASPYYPNDGGPIFKSGQTRYLIAYVCSENDPGYFNEYYTLTIYSTADIHKHSQIFAIKPI